MDKKELNKIIKEKGQEELTKKDLQLLKKNKFDFNSLRLFNFYRKMKLMVGCRKCEQKVRNSVNIEGFLKTKVQQSIEYCEKNLCKTCLKRCENTLKEYKK